MAKGRKKKQASLGARIRGALSRAVRRVIRWAVTAVVVLALVLLAWVGLYRFVNPPGGIYMMQESWRLGGVSQDWVDIEAIAPVLAQSVVAAEDANFCRHNGFDLAAIRAALAEGAGRGASTLTQQVVKNVFLWHGRSWLRKALEAALTPVVELLWSKQRILEVYLNMAEFGPGVFGAQAAARHHFGVAAADLNAVQAARLAAVLPAPRTRNASRPSDFVRDRAAQIMDGAATIARDDRGACFAAG